MKQDQVITVATRYARQKGYAVEMYDAQATRLLGEWQVSFQSKAAKPNPGDFFFVFVDDDSQMATKLVPGK